MRLLLDKIRRETYGACLGITYISTPRDDIMAKIPGHVGRQERHCAGDMSLTRVLRQPT